MRIATWNVNSLKARQEAVERWLERAAPDILLIQETKLTDDDAPVMAFGMAGYQLVHHGEGRWNGVAIVARNGLAISDVVTNFGDGPVRDSGPGGAGAAVAGEDDFNPFDEARMLAATVDGLRIVSLYAPNGRIVGSPFYAGKLAWYERLAHWIGETAAATGDLVIGGDFNIAPTEADVWDAEAVHGGTHVSEPERAAFRGLLELGLTDGYRARHAETGRFTWWDYRAGMFHKNLGMRIDHLLMSASVAARLVDAEIDRDARKGPPIPSDHAPLLIDLDGPGRRLDVDWAGALARIAARTKPLPRAAPDLPWRDIERGERWRRRFDRSIGSGRASRRSTASSRGRSGLAAMSPASPTSPSATRRRCRSPRYVEALQRHLVPQDKDWFAYKLSEPKARRPSPARSPRGPASTGNRPTSP